MRYLTLFLEKYWAENRIECREQKEKRHTFFTNSIPNTAFVVILKHKTHHFSVQNPLTLSKSQSPYKWSWRILQGWCPVPFPPHLCEFSTFCLIPRHPGFFVVGLNTKVSPLLRSFIFADSSTKILPPNI